MYKRQGLAGYEIETIVQDGIDTPVLVKFNQLSVGSLEELENFVIGLNKEQTIKIKDIAVVNEEEIKPVILKSDGLPLLTLDIETTGIAVSYTHLCSECEEDCENHE